MKNFKKQQNTVTHFSELDMGPYELEVYRSFWKSNWDSFGYESTEGHMQAALDLLNYMGYTVNKSHDQGKIS